VGLGIILRPFVGTQVGVVLFRWRVIHGGQADLPDGVTWPQFWGVISLAGIESTVSLLVSGLAFTSESLMTHAKLGILVASLVSVVV
jgi:Na+:H+ antiporter, NhaA family